MQLEMSNLSDMGCGDVYSATEFERSGLSQTCRIIPSRWVTADKGSGVVRARIVLKDVAKGSDSARALGISSPTPSSDALCLLLGIAGGRGWPIATGDVSSAFMCTPLRKRNIVAKLPMSVSSMGGEPVFLHLARALNGLRSASQEWVVFLSSIVDVLGLSTCSLEPCLFSGILPMGQPCLILVYVDDLIVTAPTCEALDFVFEKVGKEVKLKRTGTVGSSGQVRFLGRNISRQKGESSVLVSLPEDYLNDTFEDYKIKSSSKCPPDLTQYLDKENGSELSPEAYSRLRSALGKVSWLAQTRQDLRAFVGYLATQQSKPTGNTEDAMRALLRYLKSDMRIALRLPCNSEILEAKGVQGPHLVAFSDASHAPLKTTGRRGVTGGVVTFQGATLKTMSRHQQLVSLSSMEAELHAMQSVAQEVKSIGKVVGRILRCIKEVGDSDFPEDLIPAILFTDSESSLKLLKNMDIPRKSRHLEIRLEWIKEQVSRGLLVLEFRKGSRNPSDLLTKCLGTATFGFHRSSLGFEVFEGFINSLVKTGKGLVIIEICCSRNSAMSRAAKRLGVHYVGIAERMESKAVYDELLRYLDSLRPVKVFVHVSSPCTSGSPLRHLSSKGGVSQADVEWFDLFPKVKDYLRIGDQTSFELPWRNEIWGHSITKQTLKTAKHIYEVPVHLCATGFVAKNGKPVGKILGFTTSSRLLMMKLRKFYGSCNCKVPHAGILDVNWTETAIYNDELATTLVKGMIESLKRET